MKTWNKIIAFLLLTVVFSGCEKRENTADVWSEWSFLNRSDNSYLADDNGTCKSGFDGKDESARWIIESAGEYFRIKNKKTGNYLRFNQDKSALEIVKSDSTDIHTHWKYGGYDWDHMKNCGWYNIANRASPDKHLVSDQGIKLAETDINTNLSAQWNVVRATGSKLPFEITANGVKEASFLGIREAHYVSDDEMTSNYHENGKTWKRKLDISKFPQLKANNHKLLVALYNMSLEEMQLDIRAVDSTFQAGALWPDTWTRDAVYATYLAYNQILPEISKKTLQKQILKNPKEALQDTGSGGSWPISTDRIVWAMAAWEYYLATGDRAWLNECYMSLSYTAKKDIHVAFNGDVNLFKGETASMDWRTHTYPNWFTNVNIGESYSSATNALHAFLYDFLARSGKILGKNEEETSEWAGYSVKIKAAINKYFWMPEKGYYSEYMFPRIEGYFVSPRGGAMSSGLCLTLGVATDDIAKKVSTDFPMFAYGAPTLYPTIPDDFAYHNKGIWPVWESYLMLGTHKAGNIEATEHIMKSIVRQAALFLTNKENMTYDTGYDKNTALNSDRQLWSVASYLSLFYKVIFGMEFTTAGLHFNPSVPDQFYGPFELTGLKYRAAELDIVVKGSGNIVSEVLLDGQKQGLSFTLPTSVKGKHKIEFTLKKGESNKFNLVEAGPGRCWSPEEIVLNLEGNQLKWKQQPGLKYMLWNGKESVAVTSPHTIDKSKFATYNVYAMDAMGFKSDLSNPQMVITESYRYEAEKAKHNGRFMNIHSGYSGSGFVVDLAKKTAGLVFSIDVPRGKGGRYSIHMEGANGHGSHGTYCAIRSAFVDGKDVGTFIFEASGDWTRWMNSNRIFVDLPEGKHKVEIKFNPEGKGYDDNMSRNKENANDVNVDYLELVKL